MHPARKRFDDLLGELKERVMEMGVRAEKMVGDAVTALIHKNEVLAREIIEADSILDKMELEIQSTSMVLIAREAPVARDVRTERVSSTPPPRATPDATRTIPAPNARSLTIH